MSEYFIYDTKEEAEMDLENLKKFLSKNGVLPERYNWRFVVSPCYYLKKRWAIVNS